MKSEERRQAQAGKVCLRKAVVRQCEAMGCLALLLMLLLPAVVQAQFNFETNNGAITILSYTGSGGAVTIPSSTNGLPVTSIYETAFLDDSVTSITIPNSVTNIGEGAFANCYNLTSITIPNSVIYIGDYALYGCTSLTVIAVAAGNSFYSSTNGVLFDKSQTILVEYPDGLVGSYNIPSSVISIGDYAFYVSTSLTTVTIPDSVTNIGNEAFEDSPNLTSVYFEGNAPSVDSGAFGYDNNATVYYLPCTTGWGPTFAGLPAVLQGKAASNPTITTNADLNLVNSPGLCSVTNVTLTPPDVSGQCAILSINNNVGGTNNLTFPVGTNLVVWTAADAGGNSATSSQSVTVRDTEPPIINCPADVTVLANTPSESAINVALGAATATDNCSVSNITNNAPARFGLGTNLVIWTATDASGNTATCQQQVIVQVQFS